MNALELLEALSKCLRPTPSGAEESTAVRLSRIEHDRADGRISGVFWRAEAIYPTRNFSVNSREPGRALLELARVMVKGRLYADEHDAIVALLRSQEGGDES